MNNNRGNNRRRGRGSNRPQGGGQQVNRIDSRARGNAPQLLEKYRKLAHDAHLNGDRVTEEYYLQFADHYFRVIADTRVRQEEQRQRRDERWEERGEEAEEAGEFAAEGDYTGYDQQPYARREHAGREDRAERGGREDRPREDRSREERAPREERGPREERAPRRREREQSRAEAVIEHDGNVAAEEAGEQRPAYEPVENPFVRDARPSRGLRPRREPRRPREDENLAEPTFDAALLPPSISPREDAPAVADVAVEAEAVPAPKKRGRKPKVVVVEPVDEA